MEFTTHFELQSQATRLVESPSYALLLERRPAKTVLSPSQAPFSKGLGLPPALTGLLQTTTPIKDFQSELFPLHSPLMRESWLVSFPQLINMLTFSVYRSDERSVGKECISPCIARWAQYHKNKIQIIIMIITL